MHVTHPYMKDLILASNRGVDPGLGSAGSNNIKTIKKAGTNKKNNYQETQEDYKKT